MLEKDRVRSVRRRTVSRRSRPPQPSPAERHWQASKKAVRILKRSVSEPAMKLPNGGIDGAGRRLGSESEKHALSFHPESCTDIFASLPSLLSFSSPNSPHEGYKSEAKVVVTVTVEGSPGPVRAMMKLGSTVEETIENVVGKYNEERRTPKLHKHFANSSLELHLSHFSIQSLDKSSTIGDIGSRSFYLRKSNKATTATSFSDSERPVFPSHMFLLHSFLAHHMQKIIRRTRKVWKILICSQ